MHVRCASAAGPCRAPRICERAPGGAGLGTARRAAECRTRPGGTLPRARPPNWAEAEANEAFDAISNGRLEEGIAMALRYDVTSTAVL